MMIIKRACLHQKIFLISVVNELRRSGIGETSFGCVILIFTYILFYKIDIKEN